MGATNTGFGGPLLGGISFYTVSGGSGGACRVPLRNPISNNDLTPPTGPVLANKEVNQSRPKTNPSAEPAARSDFDVSGLR